MPKLFDYVKSINKHEYIFDEHDSHEYNQYLINRSFAHFHDTIHLANEMNASSDLPNQMHYDFLFNTIRKKYRYSDSWPKPKKNEDALILSDFYKINYEKMVEMMKCISDEEINVMIGEITNLEQMR